MKRWVLCILALCVTGMASAAPLLQVDITGQIFSENTYAGEGDWMQVGPIGSHGVFAWGTFSNYSAAAGLPQVGSDLDKYGWSMEGTIDAVNGHEVSYSGTGYIMAPGYGFDTAGEYLEKITWQMTALFSEDWAAAAVSGLITAEPGDRQPAGWPVAVDWATANPGWLLDGTFVSETNTLTGTIVAPVPAPGALLLGGMGVSLVGWMRRRKSL